MGRAPCCDKANVKRGPWSPEEDAKLKSYIENHGTGGNWIALPPKIGLKRCGKSCRLRWLNYLRPNLKHGGFTHEEDNLICTLYVTIGSRWSIIAGQLPGRTDNDIKNYWNTRLKKKLMGRQRRHTINKQAQSYSITDSLTLYNNNNNNHHHLLQQQIPPPVDAAAYSTNSMPNNISPFSFSCNNLQTAVHDFHYTCHPSLSRVQDQHLFAANSVMINSTSLGLQQLGGDFRVCHDDPQEMDGLDNLFDTNCLVNPPAAAAALSNYDICQRKMHQNWLFNSSLLAYSE